MNKQASVKRIFIWIALYMSTKNCLTALLYGWSQINLWVSTYYLVSLRKIYSGLKTSEILYIGGVVSLCIREK